MCGYNSHVCWQLSAVCLLALSKGEQKQTLSCFFTLEVLGMNKGSGPAQLRDSLQGEVQGMVTWMMTHDVLSEWKLTFIQVSGSGPYYNCSYNVLHGVFSDVPIDGLQMLFCSRFCSSCSYMTLSLPLRKYPEPPISSASQDQYHTRDVALLVSGLR